MADISYGRGMPRGTSHGFHASYPEPDTASAAGPGRWQTLVNWSGAVMSVALIGGIVFWGWELMVRDVSGVPVIQALEGPMRVEPANPGGLEADHQGLAVNRIAEGQEAAPAADQIVLAPPPVELIELEGGPVNRLPQIEPAAEEAVATTETAAATEAATAPEVTPEPRPQALPQISASAAPEATSEPTPEAAASATLALIDELIEAEGEGSQTAAGLQSAPLGDGIVPISVPGVRVSPLPIPRPREVVQVSASTPASAVPEAAPAPSAEELAFADLTPGTWLAQLGEFDDAPSARAFWDDLQAGFPGFFDGRARVVQETVAGGSAFFRLRAHGFDDLMDARRFCTALLAEGHNRCIPVAVR